MAVEMLSRQAPEPCRWSHFITVRVDDKEYEVQFLVDDEGVEENNINIWLDGDQVFYGGDGKEHDDAIDQIQDFVNTEYVVD